MTRRISTTWLAAGVAIVVATAALVGLARRPHPVPGGTTFRPGESQVRVQAAQPVSSKGPSFPLSQGTASGREAVSRLWYVGDRWWALLNTTRGLTIFEMADDDHTWRDTGTVVDTRPKTTADTEWDGAHLVVVSRTANGAVHVTRLSYAPATNTYSVDAGFPVRIASNGAVVVTVTRDSAGTLWAPIAQDGRVFIVHTNGNDASWSTPSLLPGFTGTIKGEDIAVGVAYAGHVGVMWSDQVTGAFHFVSHADGAPPTQWSPVEVPLSGPGFADNHISMKAAADGRVFAAVKTSLGDTPGHASAPLVMLLVRQLNGTWTTATVATVSDAATRAVVALDDVDQVVYVLLTAPEGGGSVYLKAASYDGLHFVGGRGQPFLAFPGAVVGGASASKQPVSPQTGIVVLGTDEKAGVYYRTDLKIAS